MKLSAILREHLEIKGISDVQTLFQIAPRSLSGGIGILSADRRSNDPAVNIQARAKLLQMVVELQADYLQVTGVGPEVIDGKTVEVKEISFILGSISESSMVYLAKQLSQDFFIYCGSETQGKIELVGMPGKTVVASWSGVVAGPSAEGYTILPSGQTFHFV